MNRLAITNVEIYNKTYLAYNLLDENRDLLDFQLFLNDSILNNIYIGKVENVIENLNAAFVRISPTQRCYLPLNKVNNIIYTKRNSTRKIYSYLFINYTWSTNIIFTYFVNWK